MVESHPFTSVGVKAIFIPSVGLVAQDNDMEPGDRRRPACTSIAQFLCTGNSIPCKGAKPASHKKNSRSAQSRAGRRCPARVPQFAPKAGALSRRGSAVPGTVVLSIWYTKSTPDSWARWAGQD